MSKIKDEVAGAGDLSVLGVPSGPWAPPDLASRGSTRFDVYGLAATLLQCITDFEIYDYPDLLRALVRPNVPDEAIANLLRRALDPDLAKRPADGQVFHLELLAIQAARSSKWHKQKTLAFELSGTARKTLECSGDGRAAESVITTRLGTATYVMPRRKTLSDGRAELTPDKFRLIGDQVELGIVFTGPYQMLCKWAELKEFDELERWRQHEDATMLDARQYNWTAGSPFNPRESAQAATELRAILEKCVQDAGDRFSDRFKQVRLNSWSTLIDAKEQLERRLEEPIRYVKIKRSGAEFDLETTTPLSSAHLDQERLARPLEDSARRGMAVRIVEVEGTDFVVRAENAGPDLPAEGVLVRDRTPTQTSIRRQKSALAALREGSAARPHLRDLVLDPSVARAPEPVAFTALTPDLDEDKKVAVAKALGAPDFFLVEGPPGTGKTSFICELIRQYLKARPADKVLLVSQMHVAIDNAVIRLHRSGVASIVRLSSRDDRVDSEAAPLLLANKIANWADEIRERARSGMATLAEREGLNVEHLSLAIRAEEAIATLRRQKESAAALGPLDEADRLDNEDLPEERAELLADYLRAVGRAGSAVQRVKDLAQELGMALAADLGEPELQQLVDASLNAPGAEMRVRQLVESQGDWLASLTDPRSAEPMFLPTQSVVAGTCMGFLANMHIQEMQFDLCIIDEASRATAPELLVPMTRSKRWIMVGDTKQLPPMVEEIFEHKDLVESFGLDKVFLTSSLFNTLLGEAPQECRTSLVTQHRMAEPIGELISQTFYDGALLHAPVPVLRPDTISDEDRLVWFSTSRRSGRHEEPRGHGRSSSNKLEVEQVVALVSRLDAYRKARRPVRIDGNPLEVLILSGYERQRTEIARALRRLSLEHVSVQIKTVDAVQGREADVVIFSVTRSNVAGDLGFLADQHGTGRVNVALSRAREILWIVGDSDFCGSKEGPLKRAVAHINTSAAGRVEYV